MSKPQEIKLTPRAEAVIKEFDESAQSWGYERDQGSGTTVINSEANYKADLKALRLFIHRLQVRARRQTRT